MKKIDLTKCNNCRFRAKVGVWEVEGRIAVVGDYLKFFYGKGNTDCHSMLISSYQEHGLDYFDGFEIVPRDPETYQDWQVGDIIRATDGNTGRIIFRSGDFVAADFDGCICYTCEELFRSGYRLILTDIEEKKVVEDIPKPHEFKKGELVLVRFDYGRDWVLCVYVERSSNSDVQFGQHIVTDGETFLFYRFCIPYNERTMHLLGTSEDYKEE